MHLSCALSYYPLAAGAKARANFTDQDIIDFLVNVECLEAHARPLPDLKGLTVLCAWGCFSTEVRAIRSLLIREGWLTCQAAQALDASVRACRVNLTPGAPLAVDLPATSTWAAPSPLVLHLPPVTCINEWHEPSALRYAPRCAATATVDHRIPIVRQNLQCTTQYAGRRLALVC